MTFPGSEVAWPWLAHSPSAGSSAVCREGDPREACGRCSPLRVPCWPLALVQTSRCQGPLGVAFRCAWAGPCAPP